MYSDLIEIMRDQACSIYRAATGVELSESETSASKTKAPFEEITRSFAELEAPAGSWTVASTPEDLACERADGVD